METREKELMKAAELLNRVNVSGIQNMVNIVTAYQLITGMATVEEKGEEDGAQYFTRRLFKPKGTGKFLRCKKATGQSNGHDRLHRNGKPEH